MYGETGLLLPYFQSFSHEAHHLEEFCRLQNTCSMRNQVQTSIISDYDLGGEGDLFKAPEPIIEEPGMGLDPMTAISVVSCGDDVSSQTMNLADLESYQSEQLLNEVLYECEKDLLEKSAIEESLSDLADVKAPVACMDVDFVAEKVGTTSVGTIQKSTSSGCLSSTEWLQGGGATRPNFLDFQLLDFGDAFGLRRAFSEGDIQTLGNGNTSLTYSTYERPLTIGNCNIEERKQKLSRYRKKRTKRNFGRKIKYACRKALADSQPRVRGRFAKTEEVEASKK